MTDILHFSDHRPATGSNNLDELPVVVLLHGLFGSSDNLSGIRRHLETHFRVINIDLPDHGRSTWSLEFSFEGYAQRVIHTLSSLGIRRASIVGHSLGGKVGMYIAHLQAPLIDKLIVLDIAPVAYTPRHENVIAGLSAVPLHKIDARAQAQQYMTSKIDDVSTIAFLLKSLFEDKGKWQWRFNLNMLIRDYNLLIDWPLADKTLYSGDALFVKGEDSDYIKSEYQSQILAQFPHAKAKLVKAGHWLHAQKPQIVNSIITKHLLVV